MIRNFYYRSSPYNYDDDKFVGYDKGIKYPTTMMDLGLINHISIIIVR